MATLAWTDDTGWNIAGKQSHAKALEVKADYLLIQFGHNDQKGKPAATEAEGEFRDNLKKYLTEARKKGMLPILVTPVARRTFAEGHATSTLGP